MHLTGGVTRRRVAVVGLCALLGVGWAVWPRDDWRVVPPLPSVTESRALASCLDAAEGVDTKFYSDVKEKMGAELTSWPYGPHAVAALRSGVERHRALLHQVHTALQDDGGLPATKLFGYSHQQFQFSMRIKCVAYLLTAAAIVHAADGEVPQATESCLEAQRLGVLCLRGAMLPALAGIMSQTVGRQPLWQLADQLPPEQAGALARELEQTDPGQEPLWRIMADERDVRLREVATVAAWRTSLARSVRGSWELTAESHASRAGAGGLWEHLRKTARGTYGDYRYSAWNRSRDRWEHLSARYEAAVAWARQPYGTALHLPPTGVPVLAWDLDSVDDSLLPRLRYKYTRNASEHRLLVATLALRAYHGEQHAYPPDLQSLCPRYLTAVPRDEFSGRPLRYHRAGRGFVLYSVGPDGREDGGRPASAEDMLTVLPEANGDAVVRRTR